MSEDTPNTAVMPGPSAQQQADMYGPSSDLAKAMQSDAAPSAPAQSREEQEASADRTLNPPAAPAPVAKPNFAQRMAHAAMDVFGMSRSATTYQVDPKTGATVATPGAPQKPGDWARGLLAGALRGLAGASAAKSKGLGGLGAGASAEFDAQEKQDKENYDRAQQQFANQERASSSALAQQKEQREQTTTDREYQLRKAEDARQQSTSVQQASLFEKRSTLLDQDIEKGKFENVQKQADYLQQQATSFNDAKSLGAKRLQVAGVESPEFEHLGDAEKYAMENPDATMHDGYKTRLMRNPESGKWTIMEMPYEAPKWHDVKDADGQPQRIFTDTMGALAAQEQVAKTVHYKNTAAKSALELKEQLEGYKEEGTVKGARKELDKLGYDENGEAQYGKLSPGSKSALLGDAQKQFTTINTMLGKIEAKMPELRNDEEKAAYEKYKPIRDAYAGTIAALTRPGWVQSPGAAKATAAKAATGKPEANATQFKALPAPQGQQAPKPGYVYGQGAKGLGWYKAPAQEAPAESAHK